MRGCLKFLAGLVAVLFVISSILALFVVNLVQVVTNREAVKTALSDIDQVVHEAAPALIAEAIRQQAIQQGLPPVEIDEQVMGQVMDELIPPDWVEQQAGTAVDAVYIALETGNPTSAQITLNTLPLIERMRGEPGKQAIQVIVDSLPTCTEPLQPLDLLTGSMEIPSCVPLEVSKQDVVNQVHTALVETIDLNPELVAQAGAVTVPLLNQMTPEQQAQFQQLHNWFEFGRNWSWILWFIPIGCLILIWLLAVRSTREWGNWWGQPMIISAVFALGIALVFNVAATVITRTTPPSPISDLPSLLDQLLPRLILPLSGVWLRRIYLQAGLMLAVGIGLVIMGVAAGRMNREERL